MTAQPPGPPSTPVPRGADGVAQGPDPATTVDAPLTGAGPASTSGAPAPAAAVAPAPAAAVAPAPGAGAVRSADPVRPSPASTSGPFDPSGVAWQPVSPRLVTARLLSAGVGLGIPVLVFVALAVGFGQWWPWIVVAVLVAVLAWCAVVVPRQVRAIGYAERDDDLLIRKGVMFRTLVVVPYGRMQYVDVQAGPLARKLRIAQVQLHTASPGTDASIDGLEPSEAERLRDRLASRGEARLAGL